MPATMVLPEVTQLRSLLEWIGETSVVDAFKITPGDAAGQEGVPHARLCQTQYFIFTSKTFPCYVPIPNPPSPEVENLRCFAFNVGPLFLRKASFALIVELLPITPAARRPQSFPPLLPFHRPAFR
jgi:hypothetical protein